MISVDCTESEADEAFAGMIGDAERRCDAPFAAEFAGRRGISLKLFSVTLESEGSRFPFGITTERKSSAVAIGAIGCADGRDDRSLFCPESTRKVRMSPSSVEPSVFLFLLTGLSKSS